LFHVPHDRRRPSPVEEHFIEIARCEDGGKGAGDISDGPSVEKRNLPFLPTVSRAEAVGDAFPQVPGAHLGIGAETEESGRVEVEMQVEASEEQVEERARGKWPQERGNAEHRTEAGAAVGELNSLERREQFLLIP
jgi:hypothetical protein